MTWETYEEVVKKIYEALGKGNGVSIECWGRQCKVIGKSTVAHQIDVLTKHSDGIHEYHTAIECKYWDQTINKDILMKVREIVKDANLHKAVVVSKLGFTEDALTYGKHYNIGLVELREMTEDDWKGRIQSIVINIELKQPDIQGLNFITDDPGKEDALATPADVSLYNIHRPDGKIINVLTIVKKFHEWLTKQEEDKSCSQVFNLPQNSILKKTTENMEITVSGVQLYGVLKILRKTTEINSKDYVWLMMKSVFENKHFFITKDGVINEIPPM
jgi:hypothetical protein